MHGRRNALSRTTPVCARGGDSAQHHDPKAECRRTRRTDANYLKITRNNLVAVSSDDSRRPPVCVSSMRESTSPPPLLAVMGGERAAYKGKGAWSSVSSSNGC